MKRSSEKTFLPNIWSGIGGHVEPDEFGNLRSACLREIQEETGLQPEEVRDLALRYVILRQRNDELRQQFIYFGVASRIDVGTTDEGTLHFVPLDDIRNCRMSDSNRIMLEHYFKHCPGSPAVDSIFVGTMTGERAGVGEEMRPHMQWTIMSDWE